jgi:hypothetical protein
MYAVRRYSVYHLRPDLSMQISAQNGIVEMTV